PRTRSATSARAATRRSLHRAASGACEAYSIEIRRPQVFVVDIATGATRQRTDVAGNEPSIDWSPDGREILFLRNEEPDPDRFFNYDVSAVDVETGTIRVITRSESTLYRPRWSPDGKRIAFQGTRRGLTSSETTMEDTHVMVIDADGTNLRDL